MKDANPIQRLNLNDIPVALETTSAFSVLGSMSSEHDFLFTQDGLRVKTATFNDFEDEDETPNEGFNKSYSFTNSPALYKYVAEQNNLLHFEGYDKKHQDGRKVSVESLVDILRKANTTYYNSLDKPQDVKDRILRHYEDSFQNILKFTSILKDTQFFTNEKEKGYVIKGILDVEPIKEFERFGIYEIYGSVKLETKSEYGLMPIEISDRKVSLDWDPFVRTFAGLEKYQKDDISKALFLTKRIAYQKMSEQDDFHFKIEDYEKSRKTNISLCSHLFRDSDVTLEELYKTLAPVVYAMGQISESQACRIKNSHNSEMEQLSTYMEEITDIVKI